MIDFLILLGCAFIILGFFITLSDLCNGELKLPKLTTDKEPEPEPMVEPFVTRTLTKAEIDERVQQIVVIDAIRPISPRSLDDMTHNRVEDLVSIKLGYWFQIDTPSWANIATAWFATEHLPFRARCEILTKRLTLNV